MTRFFRLEVCRCFFSAGLITCRDLINDRVILEVFFMVGEVPFELPTFRGFTVDPRLKEFRKVDRIKGGLEFIPFDSPKGVELLGEMVEYFSFLY